MSECIILKNISKKFGNNILYENVNLGFDEKKMTMIIGESGKGKTTLLNILCGIDREFTGEVILKDDQGLQKNLRNTFAFVWQNYGLIENKTAFYNLNMLLEYTKLKKHEKIYKIDEVMTKVGLKGKQTQKVFELSGGEKQRLAIASALLKQSKIILADEPTGNLDKKNTEIIMNLLLELKAEGKAIIMVTHNLELLNYADEVCELRDKKVSKIRVSENLT